MYKSSCPPDSQNTSLSASSNALLLADIRLPLTPYTSWSDNKQHTDLDNAHQWMDWLEHHVDFDQLILETANGKDYWIHVSCRKNRRANRHQVIRYLKK